MDLEVFNLAENLAASLRQISGQVANDTEAQIVSVKEREDISIAGHLGSAKNHVDFFENVLDAGPIVCKWVKNGYTPPFFKEPTRNVHTKNNKSALMNQEFLESEILEFLRKAIISEVFEPPHIINPLSVVYSNKWRCVFDCRLINGSCEKDQCNWKTSVMFQI